MERTVIHIHTDGACSGNPGPGGWGAILVCGENEKILRGRSAHTTNNRMELTAVLEAIKALRKPCDVTIHTDSVYVCMTSSKWKKWQSKKDFPNKDLWLQLVEAGNTGNHKIHYQKVAGHTGEVYNERCDRIAKEQMRKGV